MTPLSCATHLEKDLRNVGKGAVWMSGKIIKDKGGSRCKGPGGGGR
jgi:hypothetical protein